MITTLLIILVATLIIGYSIQARQQKNDLKKYGSGRLYTTSGAVFSSKVPNKGEEIKIYSQSKSV